MIINLTKSCREATRPNTPSHIAESYIAFTAYVSSITNNQCNTPLHVLVMDVLVSHRDLPKKKVTSLNKLGADASVDTHARYCQDIVQKEAGRKHFTAINICVYQLIMLAL